VGKQSNGGRYAKIVAAAVALLLLGLVTSAAIADDSPFSALDVLTSSTSSSDSASSTPTPTTSTDATTTPAVLVPTVASDKGDYAPGELVTLRGGNWHAGETVHIHANDDQGMTWERDSDVVADTNGEIVDSFNLPNWFVATYSVVATGATSGTATTAFTDANPQAVQLAPGSRTVVPGASAAYTVTVPIAGSDGQCTVDLSATGLPAGATATFGTTTLTGTKASSPGTSLTVATTGATPPGTTTFTVNAARESNCQGSGSVTGTANLVVAKSIGGVAVGAQTGALTAGTAGSATYSVTVTRNGATGTAFNANLAANGLPSGATASFNPASVSFASGDTTKSTTLTINTSTAATAGSTSFTVRATNANVDADFADGTGGLLIGAACTAAAVSAQPSNTSITYGANATFTAAGAGNPAPSVQWQVSTNSGSSWTDLVGEAGTTLTVAKPSVAQSGNQYRALFGNTCGGAQSAPSNAATLAVAAKPITVKADDKSKVYGSADPELTVTVPVGALESGDGLSGSLVREAGSSVGSYAITKGTLTAGGNYDLTVTPGTFTITPKAITVTAEDKSKVYGQDDPALTITVPAGALESGDTLSGSVVRAAGNDVGSFAITKGTLTAGSNYDLTVTPGTFTITKKPASVTADDKSKVYGAADPALTTTDSGFLAGDLGVGKITFGASRAEGESVAGGPYVITPAADGGANDLLGNYDVTYNPGSFTITTKPITVTADDQSKVYGQDDPALTVTVPDGALEAGDGLSGELVRAAGKDVGAYAITKGSLTAGGNYDLTVTPGTLTITKKLITVTADDKSKVYGSADPELTVTVPVGALESGDSLSGSLVRAAGNDVGGYAITKGSLTAGGNYDLTVTPGTLTITKKPITVTADAQTKVIGAVDPALTYTVTSGSLVSGDSFSGALTRAPGEAIGTYAITQGTLTAGGNYAVTFAGATLKIIYGWDGFLQPINDTAHQMGVNESKFKLGQTVPAKFVLKNAAGAVVRQATDPTFALSGNRGACDSTASADTTELVTPDAGVTYTWDGSQYHYNWSTKGLTAGEYRVYANLADGSKVSYVDICLTK
jgi:MBG domain-containing protein